MEHALSTIFRVLLTFVILLFTLRERVASVRKGDVSLSYYSMLQGEEIPDIVQRNNLHFANLFEVPVLFYSAGILYIAMEMSDPEPVILAWVLSQHASFTPVSILAKTM